MAGPDRQKIQQLLADLANAAGGAPDMALMEICGTHTVSLSRSGVKSLMPTNVRLISGPGCPVCVTDQGYIDVVMDLARRQTDHAVTGYR